MKAARLICVTLSAATIGLTAQGAELPEVIDLFNRHFETAGGRELWAGWDGAVAAGTVEEDGTKREFTLWVKSPGMILLTLRDARGKITRQGRDPRARLWQQDNKGVRDLEYPAAGELMAMSRAFHLAGMVEISGRLSDSVVVTDRFGGRPAFALGEKNVKRMFPRLVFDAETGLLTAWGTTRFSDYREVTNGIKVAHTLRQLTRCYTVDSVVFTNGLPEKGFQMPGGSGSLLGGLARATPALPTHTGISSPGKLEITRSPSALARRSRKVTEIPSYDPVSGRHAQVDLVAADLSAAKLHNRLADVLHADFSTGTIWPVALPEGFDPAKVMEWGKDPGLGVRALHARGLTGKGIGIGIIDLPLLTSHREFADRLRLYEEIRALKDSPAHFHGAGVAALALGKTCGVAPEAELYFISAPNNSRGPDGSVQLDWISVAQALNRFVEVNALLPTQRKIRVVSMSMGWSPGEKGYAEMRAATARAATNNIFVLSSVLRCTHTLVFDGLGRGAVADPNDFDSYGPGSWWATRFWNGEARFKPGKRLCAPMDARTTAGPGGDDEYIHYDAAGWSWSIPWLAGLYALACEVQPDITPESFWAAALRTGRTITLMHKEQEIPFGTIADPVSLIDALKSGRDLQYGQ